MYIAEYESQSAGVYLHRYRRARSTTLVIVTVTVAALVARFLPMAPTATIYRTSTIVGFLVLFVMSMLMMWVLMNARVRVMSFVRTGTILRIDRKVRYRYRLQVRRSRSRWSNRELYELQRRINDAIKTEIAQWATQHSQYHGRIRRSRELLSFI